jgi:hypothetical protein
MAQMPLKVEVEQIMGMGVTITFSAERLVDNEEEAQQFGNDMRDMSYSFAEGYGSET